MTYHNQSNPPSFSVKKIPAEHDIKIADFTQENHICISEELLD
jgi:hypothetical protein